MEKRAIKPVAPAVSALVKLADGRNLLLCPLGYYVVIQPLTKEKSDGGILLPTVANNKDVRWGRVVAVGDGEWSSNQHVDIPLAQGDVVAYQWSRGVTVEVKDHKLHAINYREVLFAIRKEDGAPLNDMP